MLVAFATPVHLHKQPRRLWQGVRSHASGGGGPARVRGDAVSRQPCGRSPDGSTFSITEVQPRETPDPDAETNLTLRVRIKKQTPATIDHTKVKIQAFLYDTV